MGGGGGNGGRRDGGTKGQRDGGTEGPRDGGKDGRREIALDRRPLRLLRLWDDVTMLICFYSETMLQFGLTKPKTPLGIFEKCVHTLALFHKKAANGPARRQAMPAPCRVPQGPIQCPAFRYMPPLPCICPAHAPRRRDLEHQRDSPEFRPGRLGCQTVPVPSSPIFTPSACHTYGSSQRRLVAVAAGCRTSSAAAATTTESTPALRRTGAAEPPPALDSITAHPLRASGLSLRACGCVLAPRSNRGENPANSRGKSG